MVYIAVAGGVRVVPSVRGPGTLCVDYDECRAHECARSAVQCLRDNSTLQGCGGLATTLPPGLTLTRSAAASVSVRVPRTNESGIASNGTNASESSATAEAGTSVASYFGIFVALTPCEGHAACWNAIGSYQCVCNAGYARYGDNGTVGTGPCQGER